jgi:hypothetical protein
VSPGTRARSVRVPDDPWDAATAVAADRGDTLSDVMRAALQDYVDDALLEPIVVTIQPRDNYDDEPVVVESYADGVATIRRN